MLVCLCFSLISFKILNSLILLGHSYNVIEKYNASQDDSESSNEKSESSASTNHNHSTENEENAPVAKPSATSESSSVLKHERRASDSKVSRNFSQIFAADSYTELTMVHDTNVIEQTSGFTMKAKCDSVTSSASDISKPDGTDSVPCDHETVSCDSEIGSHDTNIDKPKTFLIGDKSSAEKTFVDNKDGTKDSLHKSHDLQSATVFQRTSKSVMMTFGMRKSRKFGSSASLPETIGIPECVENGEASPTETKSEKLE